MTIQPISGWQLQPDGRYARKVQVNEGHGVTHVVIQYRTNVDAIKRPDDGRQFVAAAAGSKAVLSC